LRCIIKSDGYVTSDGIYFDEVSLSGIFTGQEELGINSNSLYPNPTNGVVKLSNTEQCKVTVFNLSGEKVYK